MKASAILMVAAKKELRRLLLSMSMRMSFSVMKILMLLATYNLRFSSNCFFWTLKSSNPSISLRLESFEVARSDFGMHWPFSSLSLVKTAYWISASVSRRDDANLMQSSLSADGSVWTVFWSLRSGSSGVSVIESQGRMFLPVMRREESRSTDNREESKMSLEAVTTLPSTLSPLALLSPLWLLSLS